MQTFHDQNGNPLYTNQQPDNRSGDSTAIASLILGITSIVFSFGMLIIPVEFGIGAIVLSGINTDRSPDKEKLAKAGKICGIIGIILGVLWVLFWIAIILFSIGLFNFADKLGI